MRELPTGIVTLLLADIPDGGTLHELYPTEMRATLDQCAAILRQAIVGQGGRLCQTDGDVWHASFATAHAAARAALELQRKMAQVAWAEPRPMPVRVALQTGAITVFEEEYVGRTVNHARRLLRLGHANQILLSSETCRQLQAGALEGVEYNAVELRPVGEIELPDRSRPEPVCLLVAPDLGVELAPLTPLRRLPHNLPVGAAPNFVGRARVMDEIEQWLTTGCLVTLIGASGMGKTRLALRVAFDMLGVVEHGVWLVELAGVPDSSLVVQAVASALGLREEPDHPLLDTLVDFLRPRQVLLVWDYCEHLVQECARLSQVLLAECPRLILLATSREPFDVLQEITVSVPALSAPDLERLPISGPSFAATLAEYESVRLFEDRARMARPDFALTDENVLAVAQVCRLLDGIPLALELVAACVASYPVEQIAQRLGDHFQLLTGGRHVALPRERTLRAAIGWSYGLLSESERMLLRRLAVFTGGWTLEAAEVVCWGRGLETGAVADLLNQLALKSFVVREHPGELAERYRMLEAIRQHGREQLLGAERGETVWVQGRLLDYCLRLAEQADSRLQGAEQAAWLDRLQVEYDNMRAALEWAQAAPDSADAGLRLAGALWRFWLGRGQLSEGRLWLEGALMETGGGSSVRAKAFNAAGHLAFVQGDADSAQLFYEEALALRRGVGDKRGVVESLRSLGRAARSRGDQSRALVLAEEGLAVSNELGNNESLAASLHELALVLLGQGELHRAASLFRESLSLWLEINNAVRIADCLIGLSAYLIETGQPESALKAARLLGAASVLFDTTGPLLSLSGRAEYDHSLAALKAMLDEAAFAQAWSEGCGMTREQMVAYAMRA